MHMHNMYMYMRCVVCGAHVHVLHSDASIFVTSMFNDNVVTKYRKAVGLFTITRHFTACYIGNILRLVHPR